MSRQLFIIISSVVVLLILSTNVLSEEKAQLIKGPIIITSETLTADNNAHTALFEKSVVARTTDMTLYADKMLVYYDPNTGDISKIESSGNIKLIKKTRVTTSKEATYYAADEENPERVVFTGDPRTTDGNNVVTGTKITYFLDDDKYIVEQSKVFLKKRK